MKSKKIHLVFLIIFIIFILILALFENRYFFQFNNRWFTVWNTRNGCYLILDKYRGLSFPKDDYILFDNLINVSIFVDDENKYHFFSRNCHDGYRPESHFTRISFLIHPYTTSDLNYDDMEFYEKSQFSHFSYYARDNWGFVKENKNQSKEVLTYDLKWILQRFLLGLLYYKDENNSTTNKGTSIQC